LGVSPFKVFRKGRCPHVGNPTPKSHSVRKGRGLFWGKKGTPVHIIHKKKEARGRDNPVPLPKGRRGYGSTKRIDSEQLPEKFHYLSSGRRRVQRSAQTYQWGKLGIKKIHSHFGKGIHTQEKG